MNEEGRTVLRVPATVAFREEGTRVFSRRSDEALRLSNVLLLVCHGSPLLVGRLAGGTPPSRTSSTSGPVVASLLSSSTLSCSPSVSPSGEGIHGSKARQERCEGFGANWWIRARIAGNGAFARSLEILAIYCLVRSRERQKSRLSLSAVSPEGELGRARHDVPLSSSLPPAPGKHRQHDFVHCQEGREEGICQPASGPGAHRSPL